MAKPLGLIKDPNPNVKQADVYALILNNTVVNTIYASYNDILAISANYDYCVDVTMQGQAFAGIGDTYNGATDQFIPPPSPPIDWVDNVKSDFDEVIASLLQVNADCVSGPLTTNQITQAYNSALNDNPGLDQATLNLLTSILAYVRLGG